MSPHPSLDHLILFLPPSQLSSPSTPQIPSFLSSNFTLTPGGTHADGLTANTLILLADGCYIELICFVPPSDDEAKAQEEKLEKHWWAFSPAAQARKRVGWVDWCLTTPSSVATAEQNFAHISTGSARERYAPPIPGSRLRPDGIEVKWHVTFPKGENGGQKLRGVVPFWCHDVGERGARVPIVDGESGDEGAAIRHASGVTHVKELTILVGEKELFEDMRGVYRELFGDEHDKSDGAGADACEFQIARVRYGGGIKNGESEGARIVLKPAGTEVEKEKCGGKGFCFGDVVFGASADAVGRTKGERVRLDGGSQDLGGFWVDYV